MTRNYLRAGPHDRDDRPRQGIWRPLAVFRRVAAAQRREPLRAGGGQRLGQEHVHAPPRRRRGGVRGDGDAGQARARRGAAAGSLPRRRRDHPRPRDARRRGGLERAHRTAAHRRQRRPPRRRPDGRPRGSDRRARRLHAGGAIRRGAGGAGDPHRGPPRAAGHAVGRVQAARAAGAGPGRRRRHPAARRADQPPRHPDHPLAREVPGRLRRLRGDHLARPALPGQRHQPHAGRRLRHHHAAQRRLFEGDGREGGGARPQGDGGRARRGRDRAQARLRRAVRRQEHQGHPGPEPPQADRAHRGRGAGGDARGAPRRCASSPSARAAARCWSWPASASRTATTTC